MEKKAPPRSWIRTKGPYFLAPSLLLIVCLNQLNLSTFHDLLPWKGGGFGMFSSFPERVVVVYLQTDQGELPIRGNRGISRALKRIEKYPSQGNMQRTVDLMAGYLWGTKRYKRSGLVAKRVIQGPKANDYDELLQVTGARVEVWSIYYDPDEDRLFSKIIVERTLEASS